MLKRISQIALCIAIFNVHFSYSQSVFNDPDKQEKTKIDLVSSDVTTSIIRFRTSTFTKKTVKTPKGEAFVVETDKGTPIMLAGTPDMEKLTASVIIPDQAKMKVDVLSSDYTDYPNIEIAPSKGNITRDKDPSKIAYKYGDTYQKNEFFPSEIAALRDPFIMRDHRGQTIMVYPFQYNPITKTLRVYHHITVKVSVDEQSGGVNAFIKKQANKSISSEFEKIYSNYFLNSGNKTKAAINEETGNMLIICHDAFMDAMQPFIQWKKQRGIPVEMIAISGIGNNETSLKNYVQNYYNTKGLTYLMLIGDAAQVTPMYISASGHSDNAYAYITGSDAYPEFLVGRFSAENAAHVKTQVDRIIQYEKNPDANGTWYKKGIAIGSDQGPGDDEEFDYQHQGKIRNQLLAYTYSEIGELYDGSQGGGDAAGNPGPSDVSTLVESGVGIINYTGHGGNDMFVTTEFSNSNVEALNNNSKWPFIWSVACVNGEFVDYTCFAEYWLRATDNSGNPAGAVSVMMSTINQSWNPPMEAQDQFNNMLTESITGNIKRTFGGISMFGCAKMNDAYGQEGANMTDTWTLFGDPSVVLRTNTPTALNVSHQSSVFIGSTSVQINCNSDNAVVCLTLNGEIIGTGIISGGITTIDFDALTTTDPILVTVTAYNAIPYQEAILVVPASGPYVYSSSRIVNDANGNNDGVADYMENVALNMTLTNSGIEESPNVSATISSIDSYITITDNSQSYGNIIASESISQNSAYSFTVANNVPDQHIAGFTIAISDGNGNSWNSSFNIKMDAPKLTSGNMIIDDAAGGNGNGRLDQGETANIIIPASNTGHSKSQATICTLSSLSSYITVNNGTYNIDPINDGETQNAIFSVTVAAAAPSGSLAEFSFNASAGEYSTDKTFKRVIDQAMEDFESNDFTKFDWNSLVTKPWITTSENAYEGAYCSKSAVITDNDTSEMVIELNVLSDDSISFYRKVSSEDSYDFLRFYIDGEKIDEWTGEQDWSRKSYAVTTGTHTFKWSYEKDYMESSGSDCAWVDNIIFPPISTTSGIATSRNNIFNFSIFPNPAASSATITYALSEASLGIRITLMNAIGQEMLVVNNSGTQSEGVYTVPVNLNGFSSGIYMVQVRNEEKVINKKIIITK